MKRVLAVIALIGSMLLAVIVAAYFGGSQKEGSFDKGQRFTAKPGTTRENAVALTSSKRAKGKKTHQDTTTVKDEDEGESPLTVKSLSRPNDEHRSGPAHDKAMAALNQTSAESGISQLQQTLAMPMDSEQAAVLHEAMGQLYVQIDPPEYGKAEEAFKMAREATTDPDLARSILLRAVQVLMQADENEAARRQLNDGFDHTDISDEVQFRLMILSGQLQERAGDVANAETTYQRVLDGVLAGSDLLKPETAAALARLTGLRLINLYREQDREADAGSLAKELKNRIKKLETPV